MTRIPSSDIHNLPSLEGPERLTYIRKAFGLLPRMHRPSVLDIGCGCGISTLELARLTGGEVVGIDIDQSSLDELDRRALKEGLSSRIKALNMSMVGMDLPEASQDLIWSEGSIFVMGFERGLREWIRFVKPGRFVVVHDMVWLRPDPPDEIDRYWKRTYPGITSVEQNLRRIGDCGYELLGHFPLPREFWQSAYFGPLEQRIGALRKEYAGDREAQAQLDGVMGEVELFERYSDWYGSAYFAMQRPEDTEAPRPL